MTPDLFIAEARKLKGIKFHHQGRSVSGVDCIGLCVLAGQLCGINTQGDYTTYPRDPTGLLEPSLLSVLNKVKKENIQKGDILLLNIEGSPRHVAIYTGQTIIHAYAPARKVIEHDLNDKWRNKVLMGFRCKEFG